MPLKTAYRDDWDYAERYLANTGDKRFHDLAHETSQCEINGIIDRHQDRPYEYKTDAKRDGYSPCPYCLPDEAGAIGL